MFELGYLQLAVFDENSFFRYNRCIIKIFTFSLNSEINIY